MVLVTPASSILLLAVVTFFAPAVGLLSSPATPETLSMGVIFLVVAFGVAGHLLSRTALVLTKSGIWRLWRRLLPWTQVKGIILSPNSSSLLDSWVVIAVGSEASFVLHATAGYSEQAVERRRATIDAWRREMLASGCEASWESS